MTLPLSMEPESVADVDAAFLWHENERAGLGEEFFEELLDQLDRIQQNPEASAVLYRKVHASPMGRFAYIIYYRATSEKVDVLAVLHAHRDPRSGRRRA